MGERREGIKKIYIKRNRKVKLKTTIRKYLKGKSFMVIWFS